MLFMTAKVSAKKLLLLLGLAAALIAGILFLAAGPDAAPTAAGQVASNEDRVRFLRDFGWEVAASPVQSGQVRIPEAPGEVFSRYNALQKQQGYDLTQYSGKTVMRYLYKVRTDAPEPVYATLLVYRNQVIGGDITDTSPNGTVRGFGTSAAGQPSAPTVP